MGGEEKSDNPSDKSQQNNNHRATTTESEEIREEVSSCTYSSLHRKKPWSKYISSSGDVKNLVELELDGDVKFLTTAMSLQFLNKQRTKERFEATRLKEKLWYLEMPTVTDVNYLLLKLSYLGYKTPDDLQEAVQLYKKNPGGKRKLLTYDDKATMVQQMRLMSTSYPEDLDNVH